MGNITEAERSAILQILNARLIEDGRVIGYLELGSEAVKRKFPSRDEALKEVEKVRDELLQRAVEGWRFSVKLGAAYTVDLSYLIQD